ncbi:lysophospholipid acyltransferase family protein [Lentilactobacillus kosonis]|uniref:1-acyl-sn-glycerol-3-phosphate acyltransferase n=1 Tax=Lentilactobacillus kosonis TaxID=2810561 RepID=A0A401FM61_9LACO|nr:1-acyl-sn-glycerol-3-phosphate acyltransferase [Lentilactobacillus kosonis]GAY73406.1 hypothetical protein NBRC111893_1552 [Lentilactobacillus kosonis]
MAHKEQRTIFYRNFTDDVVTLAHQEYQTPANFRYHHSKLFALASYLLQTIVRIIAAPLGLWIMHTRIKNKVILKPYRNQAVYIYGNHTAPLGDVFKPFRIAHRLNIIVAPANLKLPILGPLLPMGGAIPIPNSLHQYRGFLNEIANSIDHQKTLFIYPEAHVWPYSTIIRPFDDASFRYPIQNPAPVFCMTTTYQKSRWHKKPEAIVYLDGPFYPDENLSLKQQQRQLRDAVFNQMTKRSKLNNYEYIKYMKR